MSAFHATRYRYPHGVRYHRYAIGARFPRRYWIHDYYIDNYADYDLDPPPPDFEWMRYGPDLVLVNLDDGSINQVVYGVFDDSAADGDAPDDSGQ